jgi:hypothetical protein
LRLDVAAKGLDGEHGDKRHSVAAVPGYGKWDKKIGIGLVGSRGKEQGILQKSL